MKKKTGKRGTFSHLWWPSYPIQPLPENKKCGLKSISALSKHFWSRDFLDILSLFWTIWTYFGYIGHSKLQNVEGQQIFLKRWDRPRPSQPLKQQCSYFSCFFIWCPLTIVTRDKKEGEPLNKMRHISENDNSSELLNKFNFRT